MTISIVTIAYNESKTIEKTVESVLGQTYSNVEYIVIDGGSKDGTAELIAKYANRLAYWVSEKDGGIYDGMNKGLAKCTGDYVIFMNAGDRFASENVLEQVVKAAEESGMSDLIYGDCVSIIDGKTMIRTAHGESFIRMGMPASHQAMFYKLSRIRELGLKYDMTYRIAADYKFTYLFVKAVKSFKYVQIPIAIFGDGGVSVKNRITGLMEADRARKEVGEMSVFSRLRVIVMQSAALILSAYCGPLYRAIRLKRR